MRKNVCFLLFVADEEKLSYKLQEKLKRFNAFHKNLHVEDVIPNDISQYDFIFFDSVTSMMLVPDDFKKLIAKNKTASLIYIMQTIKSGDFKSSKEWGHLADVVIKFEDGVANTIKSRFGGNGGVEGVQM